MPVKPDASLSLRAVVGQPVTAGSIAVLTTALLIGGLWWFQNDLLSEFAIWVQHTQRTLHTLLTQAIRSVEHGQGNASWSLAAASLVYGILHAAGPGHGKAVIATYLGSNPVLIRRGLVLSLLGALLQGLTAIVIVEAGRRLLGMSLPDIMRLSTSLENVSFAFVSLLGAMILLRGAFAFYRHVRDTRTAHDSSKETETIIPSKESLFSGGGKMQPYCASCGVSHGPARHHIDRPLAFRSATIAVLSIGLRPCTGALMILMVAYSLNLRWAGIGAVLAMSLGTALAVAALAAATIHARDGILGLLTGTGKRAKYLPILFALASVVCGLLLLLLGISMLTQGVQSGMHPLLAPIHPGGYR